MKSVILSQLILFNPMFLFCQTSTIIKVNNALEFVEAIGSNITIQLEGNTIYFSDISSSKFGNNYRFNDVYGGGHELVIFDVSNFKIIGLGENPVKIISKNQYSDVIEFNDCNDIAIENIDSGHGADEEENGFEGNALCFSNTKNININKSVLFGISGIYAKKVKNLKCNNSIFKECLSDIMTIDECKEVEFNTCKFIKNYNFINLSNSSYVTFNNCSVTDNISESILSIQNCMNVIFNNCTINKNSLLNDYFDNMNNSIFQIQNSLNINFFKCSISNNIGFCNSYENNKSRFDTLNREIVQINKKESNPDDRLDWSEFELRGDMDNYNEYILDILKSIVYFNECSFSLNTICYFSRATESFQLNNCSFDNNNFIIGNFSD